MLRAGSLRVAWMVTTRWRTGIVCGVAIFRSSGAGRETSRPVIGLRADVGIVSGVFDFESLRDGGDFAFAANVKFDRRGDLRR